MNLVIFGSSGEVGRILVQLCLDNGHNVTAVTHRSNPFEHHSNLTVMNGDIHGYEDVKAAVQGNQVVLSTLGSWGTKSKDIVASGTANIIKAMAAQQIRRVITLTGEGALLPGQKLSPLKSLVRAGISLTHGKILHDGERHIELLLGSGLDWTVIRSQIMTSGDSKDYRLANNVSTLPSLVSRRAVAQSMYDQITRTDYIQQAPIVSAK